MRGWLSAVVVGLLVAGCGSGEAPPPESGPAAPGPKSQDGKAAAPEGPKSQESSPDSLAQAFLEEAGRREKAHPGKPDVALLAHHEVCVRVPFSAASKRALARCVELETDAVKAIESAFAQARATAEGLAKQGQFASAIASLASFAASTDKEALKRRAASLIELIENDARKAYVEAVRSARKSATAGSLDEAKRLLTSVSEKSTPEVREFAERDLALVERCREVADRKRSIAAEEASLKVFGERATHLLRRLKDRAYAEVLKELDAAIADPALAACKDRLTADRAAVAAASSFWDAIQKSLKARLNQEVTWKLADGKSVRGVLKKIHESGLSVKLDSSATEMPLDKLHPDQLLVMAISRDGLAEDQGASYGSAAMWFFLEGRQAESRVLLATASEMKADVQLLETSWRRGFFRLASAK